MRLISLSVNLDFFLVLRNISESIMKINVKKENESKTHGKGTYYLARVTSCLCLFFFNDPEHRENERKIGKKVY
jgi:hypothetical protein